MRVPPTQFPDRTLKSGSLIVPLGKTAVEGLHEFGRALVMNIPKAQQEGLGACDEESTLKPQQFVPIRYEIQTCRTAAQCDQFRRQAKLVEIVECQVRIA